MSRRSPPPAPPALRDTPGPPAAAIPRATPAVRPPTIGEYLHLDRYRIDGWTPTKVAAFIEVLGETGSVSRAAEYVSMTTSSAYRLRSRPGAEPFAEAWEAAIGARHERLADLAMQRIAEGVERGRWWRGECVGSERVYSDRLLMFMLQATSPDRARRAPRIAAEAAVRKADTLPAGGMLGQLDAGAAWTAIGSADAKTTCVGDCPEGSCAVCDAPQSSARDLYDAALAEATALPPDVEATVAAARDRRAAAQAGTEAGIAAIGAALDAGLRRAPPGEK